MSSCRGGAVMGSAEHNLLFGILAVQNGFVVGNQLLAAMNCWVLEKQTPLGQILLRQEALKPDELALLEALVARNLAAHGGNPERSLATINTLPLVRDQLESVADDDVQNSLAQVADARAVDPCATIVHSVGVSTSEGSRFRILRPHARGGLGEVFVANDEELSREVALKQIQDRFADQADCRSRFLLEAEITGGLEHPGIVPVYGLGAYANGRPYYAMRFIRGDSLKDAIEKFHKADKNGKLDPGERTLQLRKLLGRLIDVCNAIEYAHARGVLHRDLKPGNIMLGKYGETLVVDWGMAKVIGRQESAESSAPVSDEASLRPSSGSGSAPTQMGAAMGTPQYMSPEQAAGKHDELGPASDIYSLGATLYCLLTGQSPLADKPRQDVGQLLRRVQTGDIPSPRQIRSDIPKPLDAICRKSMALAPADRYRSSRALADDLEHWLADEPTTAQPDGVYDRLFRLARRHRSVAITTTAAAMLLAIGASAATLLVNQQRRVADRLAQENAGLARAREVALQSAEKSAEQEKLERENAERLAKEKTELALSAQKARQEAVESVSVAKVERDNAEQLAKEKTELAAAERRNREKADKLSEFLLGAIQPEDPTRFTGATFFAPKADFNTFRVFDMLKVQLARARHEFNGPPLAQAAVLDAFGDVCRQLALFESADSLLNEALRTRRKLHADDRDLATSCYHTAWYYHEVGRFEEAKELYFEALAIRRKLPDGQPLVAETLQNMAWLYYFEDDADKAAKVEDCFEEALRIREGLLKDAPAGRRRILLRDVVYTKLAMAAAYAGTKSFLDAKRVTNDPVVREQLIEVEGNTKLADAMRHFIKAEDHYAFRELPQAVEEFKKALTLVQNAGQSEKIMAGYVNFELAHTLARLNRLPEAEQQYRTGIEIVRREQMFQIPQQTQKIIEYGDVLRKLKRAPEAQSLWEEYLEAQERRFGKEHHFYKDAESAYHKFQSARAK